MSLHADTFDHGPPSDYLTGHIMIGATLLVESITPLILYYEWMKPRLPYDLPEHCVDDAGQPHTDYLNRTCDWYVGREYSCGRYDGNGFDSLTCCAACMDDVTVRIRNPWFEASWKAMTWGHLATFSTALTFWVLSFAHKSSTSMLYIGSLLLFAGIYGFAITANTIVF